MKPLDAPSSLWQPHQGVVPFCAYTHLQGLGTHYFEMAPSLDNPVKVLPHTEVFLDTSDPADHTQKHNACQGGNTALGTERVLTPSHLHPHTWSLPVPAIHHPSPTWHPTLSMPHPLILWFFLKMRPHFLGSRHFFLH